MWLDIGRLLRNDESLPLGDSHASWELDLWDEVAAIDFRESISPISEGERKVVSRALQEFDRRGGSPFGGSAALCASKPSASGNLHYGRTRGLSLVELLVFASGEDSA